MFLNWRGAAEGALIRAAASTQPFGAFAFALMVYCSFVIWRFKPLRKLCLNLLALCSVITGSANVAQSQHASNALFNPPSWILGSWQTSAVSNLNDSETFTFTAGEISFEEGFDDLTVFKFGLKFKHYKVKETIEPKIYRVELYRGANELVYEFRPCGTDACKTFSGQEGLTYSIIKNKKVVRAHETSINLVLFRPIRVK